MHHVLNRQCQHLVISLIGIFGTLIIALGIASADSAAKDVHAVKASMAQQAKITIKQAILTASKAQPGTVLKAELEKEHGPLMWEVEIVSADGALHEVHVDGERGELIGLHAQKDTEEQTGKAIQTGASDTKSEQIVDPAQKKTPQQKNQSQKNHNLID